MPRPKKQSTCHPDRQHDSLGLCHNCYRNLRNARPDINAKRKAYYQDNKPAIQARCREHWRNLDKTTKHQLGIKANARRAGRPKINKPKPVPEGPRETPVGSCDRNWWKPERIPNAWRMNT